MKNQSEILNVQEYLIYSIDTVDAILFRNGQMLLINLWWSKQWKKPFKVR
jgi:hypothetical protein